MYSVGIWRAIYILRLQTIAKKVPQDKSFGDFENFYSKENFNVKSFSNITDCRRSRDNVVCFHFRVFVYALLLLIPNWQGLHVICWWKLNIRWNSYKAKTLTNHKTQCLDGCVINNHITSLFSHIIVISLLSFSISGIVIEVKSVCHKFRHK